MRVARSILPCAVVAAAALAPSLGAQTTEQTREAQRRMLEHGRTVLLAMVDSMPERLYRDRATPMQRDFAQQIHHAAGAVALIASGALGGPRPTLPDTGTALNGRAGLRAFVNAAYDHAAGVMKAQTHEQRAATVNLFGQSMPAWQVWDEIHMHTTWTAGQVVANFRKHGMAPPAFSFF